MSRRRPVRERDRTLDELKNIPPRNRVLDVEMVVCSYAHYLTQPFPVVKSLTAVPFVRMFAAPMKGKILVVTTTQKETLYLPFHRLLRMQAIPGDETVVVGQGRQPAPRLPTVVLHFEGNFSVVLALLTGTNPSDAVDNLYRRLVKEEDQDRSYVRANEDNISNITAQKTG
jgi:hypothetical protein